MNTQQSKSIMVLTWRQDDSFEKGESLYPLLDNRLVPDVAFMIGPVEETQTWSLKNEKADLIFLLRIDKESLNTDKRNVDKLRMIIDSNNETKGLSFELVDWGDRGRFFVENVTIQLPRLKFKVADE